MSGTAIMPNAPENPPLEMPVINTAMAMSEMRSQSINVLRCDVNLVSLLIMGHWCLFQKPSVLELREFFVFALFGYRED